ncbi:MAG TPA: hypothetical protein VE646_02400 [Actinomycetota bacterium]|jgi:chromosome segregation ATPase|nr:hypothetical protein [Actinomycetota bacterium]
MPRRRSEIDELFGLEPGRFVAARDELVKRLREGGQEARATQVKALRRPTVAAWTLNQLARQHREELRGLLEAGEELRRAQRTILSGGSADLTGAGERRRALIAELMRWAGELLAAQRRDSAATREAIREGLEAASADEQTARAALEGHLSKGPSAPVGFGGIDGLQVVPGGRATDGGDASPATDPDSLGAKARDLDQVVRRAEREVDKAQRGAARAEDAARRLRREADQADRRAAEARALAERAARDLASARSDRDAAAAARTAARSRGRPTSPRG